MDGRGMEEEESCPALKCTVDAGLGMTVQRDDDSWSVNLNPVRSKAKRILTYLEYFI